MKKSDFVFVIKIFALGTLLFFGCIKNQGIVTGSQHKIIVPDTVRNALYVEEVYWEKQINSPPAITFLKK